MEEFKCCVCLGNYNSPVILNSGITICTNCADRVSKCPETNIELSAEIPNGFVTGFFRYPPVPRTLFTIKKLLKSSDKIAYMNQFDKIKLNNPRELFGNGLMCLLDIYEFKIFVGKCTDLDCSDNDGNKLFHYMCLLNELEFVKCLIGHGANIHCANENGDCPIHYACMWCNFELVKYLVEHGADITRTNKYGKQPISVVSDLTLKKGGRNPDTDRIIQYLAEHGADITLANFDDSGELLPARPHYIRIAVDRMMQFIRWTLRPLFE